MFLEETIYAKESSKGKESYRTEVMLKDEEGNTLRKVVTNKDSKTPEDIYPDHFDVTGLVMHAYSLGTKGIPLEFSVQTKEDKQ